MSYASWSILAMGGGCSSPRPRHTVPLTPLTHHPEKQFDVFFHPSPTRSKGCWNRRRSSITNTCRCTPNCTPRRRRLRGPGRPSKSNSKSGLVTTTTGANIGASELGVGMLSAGGRLFVLLLSSPGDDFGGRWIGGGWESFFGEARQEH